MKHYPKPITWEQDLQMKLYVAQAELQGLQAALSTATSSFCKVALENAIESKTNTIQGLEKRIAAEKEKRENNDRIRDYAESKGII